MKTYLISGAGSGIGRSTAVLLAAQGHRIYLLGRNSERLEQTFHLLPKNDHQVLIADIRNREELLNAFQLLHGTTLDGIVAASGKGGWNTWGEDDQWDDIINTNLTGTYNFINTFYPALKGSGQSHKNIIIISSALARIGFSNYQALSASKAGLLGLMRCWASQWAKDKVSVNAILPGWVNTQMASNDVGSFAAAYNISKEDALRNVLQHVPLGRMAEPEEISEFVSHLLNQSIITGAVIDMNGGLVMPG